MDNSLELSAHWVLLQGSVSRRVTVAKGQKKSTKEIRKPKAEKPKKQNASNPSQKGQPVEPKK
jgi:hypothetical protein